MDEKKLRGQIIWRILLGINLVATCALICFMFIQNDQNAQAKYVLYIGTNDKDSYQAEIPFDACKSIVTDICLEYVDGFTIYEADGAWKDDSGINAFERTIVCSFANATRDEVTSIANDVIARLNQGSILIERQSIDYTFYTGQ